jgi:hypothetical protein
MNASTAVQRCLDRRVAGGEPLHMRVFDHSYLPRDRCILSYDFSFSRQNSSIKSVSSSMT